MSNFRLLKRTRQVTEYSCGASALQSVLAYWGKDVDERELMALMGTTEEEGTYPERIVHAARALGFEAEAREHLTLDEVQAFTAEGHPMIVLAQVWRSQVQAQRKRAHEESDAGHYLVMLGVDDENVYFQDPYLHMCKGLASRRMFEAHWHHVMGGDATRNPKLVRLGIFVRGTRPAAEAHAAAVAPALDFAKLGSLNLIVTQFPSRTFPIDLLERLKHLLDSGDVRPNAFLFLSREKDGQLFGLQGSELQGDADAAEINAVIAALNGQLVQRLDKSTMLASIEAAVKDAAQGDFGLTAGTLKMLVEQLEPGHSALVVLFENFWERKFREIAREFGGTVTRQTLITAEALEQAARELAG